MNLPPASCTAENFNAENHIRFIAGGNCRSRIRQARPADRPPDEIVFGRGKCAAHVSALMVEAGGRKEIPI